MTSSTPATLSAIDVGSIDALLALNNAHAAELSLLDREQFVSMAASAAYAARSPDADAFVFAFDENATYDSPNFLWFRERFERFLYVDRVCVAPSSRGRGLARRLYDGVFEAATVSGCPRVVCEVNIDPPNPGSDAFHHALGFRPVGRARIHGGAKMVGYFERLV